MEIQMDAEIEEQYERVRDMHYQNDKCKCGTKKNIAGICYKDSPAEHVVCMSCYCKAD